jgi:hypothetical protein
MSAMSQNLKTLGQKTHLDTLAEAVLVACKD